MAHTCTSTYVCYSMHILSGKRVATSSNESRLRWGVSDGMNKKKTDLKQNNNNYNNKNQAVTGYLL